MKSLFQSIAILLFISTTINHSFGAESPTKIPDIDKVIEEAVKNGDYEKIWNLSKDPDPQVRLKAVDGFLALGTEQSKAKIIDMLFDVDPEVRRHSAELLTQMNWKPATDYTAIEYYIALRDWDKVAEYKESAIDLIATRLKRDSDSKIRQEATLALGKIPTQVSYNILEDVYRHDKDPDVRLAAYKSMQMIQETITTEEQPKKDIFNRKNVMIGIIILMAIITTIIFLMPILRKKKEVKE